MSAAEMSIHVPMGRLFGLGIHSGVDPTGDGKLWGVLGHIQSKPARIAFSADA